MSDDQSVVTELGLQILYQFRLHDYQLSAFQYLPFSLESPLPVHILMEVKVQSSTF